MLLKKNDISGSETYVLSICFKQSIMSPALLVQNTHDATEPLCDITGHDLSDYMQLPQSNKRLYTTFSTYAVVLPKTCKHKYSW